MEASGELDDAPLDIDVEKLPLDEPPEQEGDEEAAHAATNGAVDEVAAQAEEAAEQEALDPDFEEDEGEEGEEDIGLSIRRLRVRVVRAAMLGYKHRGVVHYTQGPRRWEGISNRCRSHLGRYPRYADCSSYATWCIWDALGGPNAGIDVVNGAQWKAGYTGTQKQHGRRVSLANAKPGDLVLYGDGVGKHVTIVVGKNKVISHGSEAGPYLLKPDYRSDISEVRRYFG